MSWQSGDPERRENFFDLRELVLMQRDVTEVKNTLDRHTAEEEAAYARLEQQIREMRDLLTKHSVIIDSMVVSSKAKAEVWTAIATSVAQATMWSVVFAIGWGLWLLLKSEIHKS